MDEDLLLAAGAAQGSNEGLQENSRQIIQRYFQGYCVSDIAVGRMTLIFCSFVVLEYVGNLGYACNMDHSKVIFGINVVAEK